MTKKKLQNVQFKRKGAPDSIIELRPMTEEIKTFKDKPNANLNKGVVTSGQEPTQLGFQLVKRN